MQVLLSLGVLFVGFALLKRTSADVSFGVRLGAAPPPAGDARPGAADRATVPAALATGA